MLGFIPIFISLLSVVGPLVGGIPFMLFFERGVEMGTLLPRTGLCVGRYVVKLLFQALSTTCSPIPEPEHSIFTQGNICRISILHVPADEPCCYPAFQERRKRVCHCMVPDNCAEFPDGAVLAAVPLQVMP